jgi:hypothetical protein
MKVYLGPYKNWIGPFQIAEKLMFWVDRYQSEEAAERVHTFGEFLDKIPGLTKFCLWVEKHRQRKIKVRIDKYDTWSMDHTLALLIVPMLKQLRETKHGSPFVDDEDVPETLRSTAAPPKENEWDTDDNHHVRWDWVLGEMIFAFESKLNDNWDDEFWTGEFGKSEFVESVDEHYNPLTNKYEKMYTMVNTGNRTCDWEGRQKVQNRITNGFRLFGKYYEGLWD